MGWIYLKWILITFLLFMLRVDLYDMQPYMFKLLNQKRDEVLFGKNFDGFLKRPFNYILSENLPFILASNTTEPPNTCPKCPSCFNCLSGTDRCENFSLCDE